MDNDDKYKELEELYLKKCEKVKELSKEVRRLRKHNIDLHDEYGRLWNLWSNTNDNYKELCKCVGQQYYKVTYTSDTVHGNESKCEEVVLAPHAKIAVQKIEQKEYENYKFISVCKLT